MQAAAAICFASINATSASAAGVAARTVGFVFGITPFGWALPDACGPMRIDMRLRYRATVRRKVLPLFLVGIELAQPVPSILRSKAGPDFEHLRQRQRAGFGNLSLRLQRRLVASGQPALRQPVERLPDIDERPQVAAEQPFVASAVRGSQVQCIVGIRALLDLV